MTWGTEQELYTRKCMIILMHRYLYYILHDPEINDTEYDFLEKELEALEASRPDLVHHNSPTRSVGSSNPMDYPRSIRMYFEGRKPKPKIKKSKPKKEEYIQESLF